MMNMRNLSLALLALVLLAPSRLANAETVAASSDKPLSLVVMDPLAAPLSCPCVEGYAQRKYEELATYLTVQLRRPVTVTFSNSLQGALDKSTCDAIELVIGKDSVVRHDARKLGHTMTPIAQLTGKKGLTTQTGLIVVPSADPAKQVKDLAGYRIIFGPEECDEKFAAARDLLTSAGVELPPDDKLEVSEACSDGACQIVEWGDKVRAAAVISSYAAPLLEGCGSVKKGDLRVIGTTETTPFVTAFTSERIDPNLRQAIRKALHTTFWKPELLIALETQRGFVKLTPEYRKRYDLDEADKPAKPEPPTSDATTSWPGWLGPNRDGRCAALPDQLSAEANIVWQKNLFRPGLGGIAATEQYVIVGTRNISNQMDVFHCLHAATGEKHWKLAYPAAGQLDYDNDPRATPLIHGERVFLLGAFGDLTCVELKSGRKLWRKNILRTFGVETDLVWGVCATPLLVDGKLIVNPGGPDASLAALDPETGQTIWTTPGTAHAYSSPIVATLGGVRQIVTYDRKSLGGWDPDSGKRLWTLTPPVKGDFNVPTPLVVRGKLLVTSENNGTRLYEFDDAGKIIPQPVGSNRNLAPDMSTPVVVGDRVYCVNEQLYCLDLTSRLSELWAAEHESLGEYGTLLATDDRLLTVGRGGELLLIDATASEFRVVSRLDVFPTSRARATIYAAPAIVGNRLFMRGEKKLVCVNLSPSQS